MRTVEGGEVKALTIIGIVVSALVATHFYWYMTSYLPVHRANWGVRDPIGLRDWMVIGLMHLAVVSMVASVARSIWDQRRIKQ
jgi:hypothetical protein